MSYKFRSRSFFVTYFWIKFHPCFSCLHMGRFLHSHLSMLSSCQMVKILLSKYKTFSFAFSLKTPSTITLNRLLCNQSLSNFFNGSKIPACNSFNSFSHKYKAYSWASPLNASIWISLIKLYSNLLSRLYFVLYWIIFQYIFQSCDWVPFSRNITKLNQVFRSFNIYCCAAISNKISETSIC